MFAGAARKPVPPHADFPTRRRVPLTTPCIPSRAYGAPGVRATRLPLHRRYIAVTLPLHMILALHTAAPLHTVHALRAAARESSRRER